jgi:putative MATE family efflux protein
VEYSRNYVGFPDKSIIVFFCFLCYIHATEMISGTVPDSVREGTDSEVRRMAGKPQVNILDETQKPYKALFMLAWPVFVEQIATTLVNFVDAAMVGSLGKEATAAISVSNSPSMAVAGAITALGVGMTASIAKATGAGDDGLVRRLMRQVLLMALYIGVPAALLLAVLSRMIPLWMGAGPDILDVASRYNLITALGRIFSFTAICIHSGFRGYGDTKSPMIANLALNGVNVVGNYLLIFPTRTVTLLRFSFTMPGAGWGVAGAAAATATAMMISCVIALYNAFKKSNPYRIRLEDKKWYLPERELSWGILKISLPAVLERLCLSSAQIVGSRSIAFLGTASIAARSLCGTAESLSYMPAFAFQTAITTLVGQAYGAKKITLADRFVRVCIQVGGVIMFFTGVALFVFAEPIIGVFTPDREVIVMGAACLRVEAVIQVPQVIGWIYAGALRGFGNTKIGFWLNAFTGWCIRTPGLILAVRVLDMPLTKAYWVIGIEIVVRFVLFWIYYKRYRRNVVPTMVHAAERA